jgi:hypothetical protein
MYKLSDYISEAFDKPYEFRGGKRDNDFYSYKFQPLGPDLMPASFVDVTITGSENADDEDEYIWEIVFSRQKKGSKTRYDTTGEGDAMRIFATVIKVVEDFVKKENPKYLSFQAEKDKPRGGKGLQSREKLYSRMVSKFFSKKYTVKTSTNKFGTVFNMKRKGK